VQQKNTYVSTGEEQLHCLNDISKLHGLTQRLRHAKITGIN